MPGWIAQWYGNVPAVCSATLNRPPGATLPEFHPWMSDVEVCATESVFVQVLDRTGEATLMLSK